MHLFFYFIYPQKNRTNSFIIYILFNKNIYFLFNCYLKNHDLKIYKKIARLKAFQLANQI